MRVTLNRSGFVIGPPGSYEGNSSEIYPPSPNISRAYPMIYVTASLGPPPGDDGCSVICWRRRPPPPVDGMGGPGVAGPPP